MKNLTHILSISAFVLGLLLGTSAQLLAAERFSYTNALTHSPIEKSFVPYGHAGFSHLVSTQGLRLMKSEKVSEGLILYSSTFRMVGNFSVSVSCSRESGDPVAGLLVRGIIGARIQLTGQAGREPRMVYGAACAPTGVYDHEQSQPRFRIRRVGEVTYVEHVHALGWKAIAFGTNCTAPVSVEMFLRQDGETSAASSVVFEHLQIEADSIEEDVERVPSVLMAQPTLTWASEKDKKYQIQFRMDAFCSVWVNDRSPLLGTGEEMSRSVSNSRVPAPPLYGPLVTLYRVVVVP